MTGVPGHIRGKSSSAPAAPLLAAIGEHILEKAEVHGVSRSSPDTPLSDLLNESNTNTLSLSTGSRVVPAAANTDSERFDQSYTESLSQSAGSRGCPAADANTGAGASTGLDKASHADVASCSASGSLSDRSINLCFPNSSPGPACGAVPSPLFLAATTGSAAAAQRSSLHGPSKSPAAALGPILAFQEHRGFCDNPFARIKSCGTDNARQLRRKLSGRSGSLGQLERHRLGRLGSSGPLGSNGLAQGQLSLLLKQQQSSQPAAQSSASPGSQQRQQSLLSMQLKGSGIEGTAMASTTGPSTLALQGSEQLHSAQTTQRAACRATSAVEPLRAVFDEAEGSPHHRPPTPFWQATLMAATSAPRPNLGSTLQETPRILPHAMSDVLPGSRSSSDKEQLLDQDEKHLRHHVQTWLDAAVAVSGHSLSSTPLPHHRTISPLVDRAPVHDRTANTGRLMVSPEAMELIQAMDKSLVTPARSESGFPGPLATPIDISTNILSGGFQAVCAGFSPVGRHARVPPRQVSGHLTNMQRARTWQGSLSDSDEINDSGGHLGSWAERVFIHLPHGSSSRN